MDSENLEESFTTKAPEYEGTLCRIASEHIQVVVLQSLEGIILGMSHYAKLAGRPGGRKLYVSLGRYLYRQTMALDCYAVARNCLDCARERVKLRKNGQK